MRQEELDAALKKAIQEKDILKARALIKQGADVNQTDQQGNTLLHSTSDLSAMRLLIQNGAHVNVINKKGLTPLDVSTDEKAKKYLVFNGGISASKVPPQRLKDFKKNGRTVVNIPPCAPVTEKEIRSFCKQNIKFIPDTPEAQETLVQGLIEVCKTPTGRLLFQNLKTNIQVQKELKGEDYKLCVEMVSDPNASYLGCVHPKNPNTICLNVNKIKKIFTPQAASFKIGSTFLHESSHVQQFSRTLDPTRHQNLTTLDAPTQASSYFMELESPYLEIRAYRGISDTEYENYKKSVNLKKDGTFDVNKAFDFSINGRSQYIREFKSSSIETPVANHSYLSNQILYLFKDIHPALLIPDSHNFNNEQFVFDHPVSKALQGSAQVIMKHATLEERKKLYVKIMKGLEIKRSDFKSEKAYKAAIEYQRTANIIKNNIIFIARNSPKIQDNPEDKELRKKTAQARKTLKKYGIDIPTHNKKNERVADSVDMAKKKAPNEKENPVLPHEKGPQSDATRAMAEFHAPEGDKAEIHAPTPRNNHNHTA